MSESTDSRAKFDRNAYQRDYMRKRRARKEATDSSRALSERDRDYYDHKQLTADQIRVLRKRRQPEVVIPRVQAKVKLSAGL